MPIKESKEDPLQFWGWRANKGLTRFKGTVAHCFSNQPWSLEGLSPGFKLLLSLCFAALRALFRIYFKVSSFLMKALCLWVLFFFWHFGWIWNQMVSNRIRYSSGTGSISLELCWFILQPIPLEQKLSYGNRAEKPLAWLLWDQAVPLELAGMQAVWAERSPTSKLL